MKWHGPEILRRAHAWLRGFFWIPCPLCGRMFGGQEFTTKAGVRAGTSNTGNFHSGKVACWRCADRGWEHDRVFPA